MTSTHNLPRLYKGGFFFALHYALITYASSTYLEQFLSPDQAGFVFTAGSLLGIVLVYASIRFWRRNAKVLLGFVIPTTFLLLILLATLPYAQIVGVLFSMYLGFNFLGWYLFDIAIEHESSDETTGQIRGSYLTFVNVAWLFSPLISGILITQGGFTSLFFASAGASLLAFFVIARDSRATLSTSRHTLKLNHPAIWITKPEIKKALYINFTLQFFYSAMVVVTPIYLIHTLGIGWETLGKIFFIMLLPFVLVDYPLGRLADKRGNEKKILIIGTSILTVFTVLFAFFGGQSIFLAALILYGTRVGASIIEIITDSYFFKHVGERDMGSIAMYRMMTPVAFLFGPLFAFMYSSLFSYSVVFVGVAVVTTTSIIVASRIKDI